MRQTDILHVLQVYKANKILVLKGNNSAPKRHSLTAMFLQLKNPGQGLTKVTAKINLRTSDKGDINERNFLTFTTWRRGNKLDGRDAAAMTGTIIQSNRNT